MLKLSHIALLFLAMAACVSAQAQVYKWKDANGVIHYDDKAPEGSKAKEVHLREASPAGAAPTAVPGKDAKDGKGSKDGKDSGKQTLQEKEIELRTRRIEREQADAKKAKERAERDEECKNAAADLADKRRTPVLYDLNDKGERVYKSDKEREAWLATQQKEYDQHCK